MVLTDTSDDESTIVKFKHEPYNVRIALNTSMNTRHVCCSILFTCSFICPHKTKKFITKSDFTTSIFYKNLAHTETCSCVKHQLLHHQLRQSIQRYYTLLQFFTYHFAVNFDYLVLYIWRCVFYPRMWGGVGGIQVRLVFRRVLSSLDI